MLRKALKQPALAVQEPIETVHQRKVFQPHRIAMTLHQRNTYLERINGGDELCALMHTHTRRCRLAVHLTFRQRQIAASILARTYVDMRVNLHLHSKRRYIPRGILRAIRLHWALIGHRIPGTPFHIGGVERQHHSELPVVER